MPPSTPASISKAQKAMKTFFFIVRVRFIRGGILKFALKMCHGDGNVKRHSGSWFSNRPIMSP
jgi:hypothetical protein